MAAKKLKEKFLESPVWELALLIEHGDELENGNENFEDLIDRLKEKAGIVAK